MFWLTRKEKEPKLVVFLKGRSTVRVTNKSKVSGDQQIILTVISPWER